MLKAGRAEFRRRHAQIDEDVIRVGIGHLVTEITEKTDDLFTNFSVFLCFPGNMLLVFQRGQGGDGAEHVDVSHAPGVADLLQGLRLGNGEADAHARQTVGLGKRPGDEHVFVFQRQRHGSFHRAGPCVIDIGLVDVDIGVRILFHDAADEGFHFARPPHGAGGIVRVAQIQHAGAAGVIRKLVEIDGQVAVERQFHRPRSDTLRGAQAGRIGRQGSDESLFRIAECANRALQQGRGTGCELNVFPCHAVVIRQALLQFADMVGGVAAADAFGRMRVNRFHGLRAGPAGAFVRAQLNDAVVEYAGGKGLTSLGMGFPPQQGASGQCADSGADRDGSKSTSSSFHSFLPRPGRGNLVRLVAKSRIITPDRAKRQAIQGDSSSPGAIKRCFH